MSRLFELLKLIFVILVLVHMALAILSLLGVREAVTWAAVLSWVEFGAAGILLGMLCGWWATRSLRTSRHS